jgi:hypothetical protein
MADDRVQARDPEATRGGPARDELPAGQAGPDTGVRGRRGRGPRPERPRRDTEHAGRLAADRHPAAVHGQYRPYPGQPADGAHLRGADASGQHREQVRHDVGVAVGSTAGSAAKCHSVSPENQHWCGSGDRNSR